MKHPRVMFALGLAGMLGLSCGCNTLGGDKSVRGDTRAAALNDGEPPSTLPGGSTPSSSRSTGTWSSESQNIEKGLLNRSASPTW